MGTETRIGERPAGFGHDRRQGRVVPDVPDRLDDDLHAPGRQAGVSVRIRPAAAPIRP